MSKKNFLHVIELYQKIKIIFQCFPTTKRRKLIWLILLIFCSGVLELITVASVFPLFELLSNKQGSYEFLSYLPIMQRLIEVSFKPEYVVITSFILFSLLSGIVRIIAQRLLITFSFEAGAEISTSLLDATLKRDFSENADINSSDTIAAIFSKSNEITVQILMPILNVANSITTTVLILTLLSYVSLNIVLLASALIFMAYLVIGFYSKNYLAKDGVIVNTYSNLVLKHLQESSSGLRDLIFNNLFDYNLKQFSILDRKVRSSKARITIIGIIPRYIIETFLLLILGITTLSIIENDSDFSQKVNLISTLSVFAVGAQKLLPLFQTIFNGYSQFKSALPALNEVVNILKLRRVIKPIEFRPLNWNSVSIYNGEFSYSGQKTLLEQINFSIFNGDKIGIVGETGSGKSTLLDVLSGLVALKKGEFKIDDQPLTFQQISIWQSQISYVPQNIFLFDDSIINNLYPGKRYTNNDVTDELIMVSKICCIYQEIMEKPEKFETSVGEGASKLSGGQRQRLGIARALLSNKEIVIFDEASSALSMETEGKVFENIFSHFNKKTFIMVTHRPEVLKYCNKIFHVQNNTVVQNFK